jgi:nitrous oxidase accessory protein NosD
MSITTTTRSAGPFVGDGTTAVLPFNFKVFTAGDLKVERTSALGVVSVLALSTHYTVTLNVDQDIAPGGSVVLLTPLAVGERAVLTSDVDATQPLQIRNGGPFLARAVEEALDRQMIVLQQLGGALDRSVRGPSLDVLDELPPAAERALRVLAFDAAGQPVASIPASGTAADVMLQLAGGGPGQGADLVSWRGRSVGDWLDEATSVLSHGADNTGVSDACAAIQAAVIAAQAGGVLVIPPGTYRMVADSVGYQVLIDKPLTIIAEGAVFNVEATATPANHSQERHNAIFRVLQVDGFTWRGGLVNGGRQNATVPLVGWIVGHGCKNADVSGLVIDRLDHNFGAIAFDAVMPGFASTVAQENIRIHHNHFTRCYYGVFVRGTVSGLEIAHNTGRDFDLQDPQTGHPRLLRNEYGGIPVGVYGFDGEGSNSTQGGQRGVRIVGNYFDGMTQGPVAYNFASNAYTSATDYECRDIVMSGNIIRRALTGYHINGWDIATATGNSAERLALDAAQMSGYAGTSQIGDTAGIAGAMIEISTAGRTLTAVGNTLRSYWTTGADYSGGATGIDYGATSNTTDTSTRCLVSGNHISGFYIGIRGTGNVLASVTANRIERCRRYHENDVGPLNGGAFAEGVFSGNTVRLDGYTGTKVGGVFRGAWSVRDNEFIGDTGAAYDYAVQMAPGARTATFTGNTILRAVQGVYLQLSGSTVVLDGNRFEGVTYPVEVVKDATSTVKLRGNAFGAGTTTAVLFSGAGSHGSYAASNNDLGAGGWASDGTAALASQLGYSAAAPTAGTFTRGCSLLNIAPSAGGSVGWVCTTGGAPGTWKTFGAIAS